MHCLRNNLSGNVLALQLTELWLSPSLAHLSNLPRFEPHRHHTVESGLPPSRWRGNEDCSQHVPYQTCTLSILLYSSETWTLLQEDLRKLQVFHMRSQHMILGIRWHDFVRNTEVVDRTGLPCVRDVIAGSEWVSSCLTAHQHNTGYSVPLTVECWNDLY